ncbi:proton extrusion protein PcxA [Egbenema bharatensis]|uniref:proton extrusion protein PcxA n=1 Tax=Egbenema bharatensis TaxID=3463334 RepID=UPI003A83FD07
MRSSVLDSIKSYFRTANRWFLRTPERALDEAYEAAQAIRRLEEERFNGSRIPTDSGSYGRIAQGYFQSELKKNLDIIKIRISEFRISSAIFRLSSRVITEIPVEDNTADLQNINVIDRQAVILRKLQLIDEILSRYGMAQPDPASVIVISEQNSAIPEPEASVDRPAALERPVRRSLRNSVPPGSNGQITGATSANLSNAKMNDPAARKDLQSNKSITEKTGVLPRSILETVDRIKRELDPEAEQQVVRDFRKSKARTIISLRLVLFLIIIPLLTQQVTKTFLVGPVVDRFRSPEQATVFLNEDMEMEALGELERFEQHLRFEILVGRIQPQSEEEIADRVRERAQELETEFRRSSSDSVKNVFADMFALVAFTLVLVNSRKEIEVLKSFIDQMIYGLSDSAKAFVIILFTDMFVGFHSPHGWEILLEGVSRHFGLPANRDFIFLFIATFPVILDTIFKYWIFRYLNRVSPSAVATYKNMNE